VETNNNSVLCYLLFLAVNQPQLHKRLEIKEIREKKAIDYLEAKESMETKEILSLDHTTLAVPFVQELVKKPLTSVPLRYVHPDQDPTIISLDSSSPQIPIIDMQRLLFEDFMDSELQKLDQACREWGFFPVDKP
jgi:hypothetical protein